MRQLTLGMFTLLCLACSGGAGPDAPTAVQQALDATNGDHLNGDHLNGDHLNGTDIGTHVVSVRYDSTQLNGSSPDRVWLQGSEFFGTRGGANLQGQDFEDATFTGLSDTGASVKLRVTQIWQDAAPDQDVWNYQVSYRDVVNNTWSPLCQDASGNAVPAIAVDGYWSYAQGVPGGGAKIVDGQNFTFACRGLGAIGKCIGFGYEPWRTVNGVSVDRYHQACVRLIRADFCGDGTPYTQDGNRVNLYDGLGIQQDTEDWVPEAEWDERGARCFSLLNRSHSLVPCYDPLASLFCGNPADFQSGTLMIDETPTAGLTP